MFTIDRSVAPGRFYGTYRVFTKHNSKSGPQFLYNFVALSREKTKSQIFSFVASNSHEIQFLLYNNNLVHTFTQEINFHIPPPVVC